MTKLRVFLPVMLAAFVAACGTRNDSAADAQSGKVLHVYNWADYIGESTIREFEARSSMTSTTRPRSCRPSC